MDKNQGKTARDALAAAVNRTIDECLPCIQCDLQAAADVIEQRDTLLSALEKLEKLLEPVRYNTIEIDCSPNSAAMTIIKNARAAVALAKGE